MNAPFEIVMISYVIIICSVLIMKFAEGELLF